MILLALAVVAFLLFAGKSPAAIDGAGIPGAGITPIPTATPTPTASASPQTPIIKNATGGSLSAALGTSAAPPNYYASGNPGYDTQLKPAVSNVRFSTRIVRSGVPFTNVSETLPKVVTQPVNRGTVNVPLRTPTNPLGTLKPIIANRPVVIVRNGPEIAAAPWSRLPVRTAKEL